MEMDKKTIWSEYDIPGENPEVWDFGPLRLWCKTLLGEMWLVWQICEEDRPCDPPESSVWCRWALKDTYSKIRFSPIFPDKPVVVKPESSFILTPRTQAKVFVRCPLWVKIELVKNKSIIIEEIPIYTLSKTWFGSFTDGDICYWISSGTRREIENDPSREFFSICPIFITNGSDEELVVEKICLRVGGLSIYDDGGQLWSDLTSVTFKGSNSSSQIKYVGKPPVEAPDAKLVSLPRNPVRRNLFAGTFNSLKEISGLGLLLD